MNKIASIMNSKHFIFTKDIINNIDYDMTLNDFLVLVYFINSDDKSFNPEKISEELGISMNNVMDGFNSLITHNIITLDSKSDKNNKIVDVVSLDNLYNIIDEKYDNESNISKNSDIFDKIEKEFGKSLSPIECEIINGWLSTNNSEELILGALKEATFNGVKNLRYIDKILYEWGKKGFKNMDDVNKHLKNNNESNNNEELFDYDWLNDDE